VAKTLEHKRPIGRGQVLCEESDVAKNLEHKRPVGRGCCSGGKRGGRSPGTQILPRIPSFCKDGRDWRRPPRFSTEQHPRPTDGL